MNKTDLINQLAERLDGDKKTAQAAVEGFIDLVQREVHKGSSVSISGFGVFEKRARAARTARNPRTGESVKVRKTNVPAFRPGKYFKDVIAGSIKMPKSTGQITTARAAAALAKASTTAKAAPKAADAAPARTTRARATKAAATEAAPAPARTTRARATKAAAAETAPARTTRATRATKATAATEAAPAKTTRARATTKTAAAPKTTATKTTAAKSEGAAKTTTRRSAAKSK
ncbi:HU family DNA-binding protein [Nakamurella leprariae]|uniref:HU family DNA-binding protein n=1 Tax=Nakamurella leprariae TaxID=2803911 RepID=UPI002E291CBA|nr:HU family DNA-binding protein [Nakamurella leprariae]